MITVELVKGAIQIVERLSFSDGRSIVKINNSKKGKSIVYKTPDVVRPNSNVWAPAMKN